MALAKPCLSVQSWQREPCPSWVSSRVKSRTNWSSLSLSVCLSLSLSWVTAWQPTSCKIVIKFLQLLKQNTSAILTERIFPFPSWVSGSLEYSLHTGEDNQTTNWKFVNCSHAQVCLALSNVLLTIAGYCIMPSRWTLWGHSEHSPPNTEA